MSKKYKIIILSLFIVLAYMFSDDGNNNIGYKKEKIKNGRLFHSGVGKQIDNIKDYLKLYSDDELKTVKKLSLSLTSIKKIDGLERLPNLIGLTISVSEITKIENLEVVPNLEGLTLGTSKIEKIEGISHLKKLRWLDLSRNKIRKVEGLENLTNLIYLNLSNNPLEDVEGLYVLRNMEYINIRGDNPIFNTSKYFEVTRKLTEINPGIKREW